MNGRAAKDFGGVAALFFRLTLFMRLCQTRLAKRGGTEVWGIGFFSPCRWNSSPDKFEREGAEAHASYRRAKEPGKFISEKVKKSLVPPRWAQRFGAGF